MRDKTAVKRNASYRQRKQEAGLVLLQVWVRPEDRDKVRKYAEKLRKEK